MGMDMVAAWVWAKKGEVNWSNAKAVLHILTSDELEAYDAVATGGLDDLDANEIRDMIEADIDTLAGSPGDLLVIDDPTGHYELWFAGGMSWGDDPNDEFTAINNLLALPRLLQAAGFKVTP